MADEKCVELGSGEMVPQVLLAEAVIHRVLSLTGGTSVFTTEATEARRKKGGLAHSFLFSPTPYN
jgi:hypothetical protein